MTDIIYKPYEININRAATFIRYFIYTDSEGNPFDLTNYTIYAQLREFPESADAIDFTVTESGITGYFSISLSAEETSQINFTVGYYDVYMVYDFDHTNVQKIIGGQANCYKDVTHINELAIGVKSMPFIFDSFSTFPTIGTNKVLYIDASTNSIYRWADDSYVKIAGIGEQGPKGDDGTFIPVFNLDINGHLFAEYDFGVSSTFQVNNDGHILIYYA